MGVGHGIGQREQAHGGAPKCSGCRRRCCDPTCGPPLLHCPAPPPAGSLWLVYGIAISDLFIAVPNGVGAVLGAIYCLLICAFPRKGRKCVRRGGAGAEAAPACEAAPAQACDASSTRSRPGPLPGRLAAVLPTGQPIFCCPCLLPG